LKSIFLNLNRANTRLFLSVFLVIIVSFLPSACGSDDITDEPVPQTEEEKDWNTTDDDLQATVVATQDMTLTDIVQRMINTGASGESLAHSYLVSHYREMGYDVSSNSSAATGAKVSRISYQSVDANGNPVTLSALVAIPYGADGTAGSLKINSVLVGCHVTITHDKNSPWQWFDKETTSSVNDIGFYIAEALTPAIVVCPDYMGYGVSKNETHPYLIADQTARNVYDAVVASLNTCFFGAGNRMQDETWNIVFAGYSQGAAVALGTMRWMEKNNKMTAHIGGSFVGDGPYDPVATFQKYAADGQISMPAAVALTYLGAKSAYPDLMSACNENDVFTTQFVNTGIFDWISSKDITVGSISARLKRSSAAGGIDGDFSIANILSADMLDASSATSQSFTTALSRNRLTEDWQPQHPILMFHSKADEVVPYVNAQNAMQAFASSGQAKLKLISGPTGLALTIMKIAGLSDGDNHSGNGTEFCYNLLSSETVGWRTLR